MGNKKNSYVVEIEAGQIISSKSQSHDYDVFADYQLPELLRTPLQSLCLQIKSLQLGSITEFLSSALQLPKPLSVSNTTREKSYEVSPYNSSDDEDDEDDDVSSRKFVPTWASKKSLALVVSLQKDINPDILFYPESFSSVDEVSGLGAYKKK